MGGAMIPLGLLFHLWASQHWWVGPDFPKMVTSRGTHTHECSQDLCLQCPSPTMSHSHPLFSQAILQELWPSLTQIPVESLLCLGSQNTQMPVFPFQEWGLCFPQSHGAPLHKLYWPSKPDPQVWGSNVGLRTLTSIGDSLLYSYFPDCELPTWLVWGCLYHVIALLPSWCGLLFVFWSRKSFWKFPVHLIEGCSAFGCNFVVFMREGEL